VRRHVREVALDHIRLRNLAAVGARAKRPVCHAAEIELLVSDKEKLSPDGRRALKRPGAGGGRWCDERRDRTLGLKGRRGWTDDE